MGLSSVILSGIVSMSCGGMKEGNSRNGCSHAIEAVGTHTGADRLLSKRESIIAKNSEEVAEDLLGETGMQTIGAIAFIARMATGGRVKISTKGPVGGRYFVETNLRDTRIGMGWTF